MTFKEYYKNFPSILSKKADDIAKARVDALHKSTGGRGISYADDATKAEKKAFNDLADKYFDKLKVLDIPEELIRDNFYGNNDLIDLFESGKDYNTWLKDKRSEKFRADTDKILYGKENDKGEREHLDNDEMALLATQYGYQWGDKAQRAEFMDKVREQGEYNQRAKTVDDYNKSASGIFTSIVSPTAHDEAVKQALTGKYNNGRIYSAAALDLGTNVAIGASPLIGNYGRLARTQPFITNVVAEPALQASAEAVRQVAQGAGDLGDETFNLGDVGSTALFGTITPATKGVIAEGAGRLNGVGRKFAQGMQSTSAMDPVELEKGLLTESLEDYAKRVRTNEIYPLMLGLDTKGRNMVLNRDSQLGVVLNQMHPIDYVDHYVHWLNADKKRGRRERRGLDEQLKLLDEFNLMRRKESLNDLYANPTQFDVRKPDYKRAEKKIATDQAGINDMQDINNKQEKLLDVVSQYTPELNKSLTEKKGKAYLAGKGLGILLTDLGDAYEPAYKFNPVTALSPLLSNNGVNFESQVNGNLNKDNYRFTDWYKKLPKSKKIILDEAFKDHGLLTENN